MTAVIYPCPNKRSPSRLLPCRSVDIRLRQPRNSLEDTDIGIRWDSEGPHCVVSVSGRITIDSSPELRMLLLQQLRSPACQSLTVDFHDVEYMDTSGLAILVEILRAARAEEKSFHLTQFRGRPRFLLEATGLLHLFDEQSGQEARLGAENKP